MIPSFITVQGNQIIIKVYVQPKASKTEAFGVFNERLKVRLNAPPVDGKANQALVEYFAKLFGVAKSQVQIISGETGRNKTITVKNCNLNALPETLKKLGF